MSSQTMNAVCYHAVRIIIHLSNSLQLIESRLQARQLEIITTAIPEVADNEVLIKSV